MKFKDLYLELAKPREKDKNKFYYHGTRLQKNAEKIKNEGIDPGNILIYNGNSLTPIINKVYLTKDLKYSIIYALGGDVLGSNHIINPDEKYGYVFKISGMDLKDIQPDEDDIGILLSNNEEPEWLTEMFNNLKISYYDLPKDLQKEYDKINQFNNFIYIKDLVRKGEYAFETFVGKLLIKNMSDEEKLEIIDLTKNISHEGKIHPIQGWKFNKKYQNKLYKDGSNFFQLAEEFPIRYHPYETYLPGFKKNEI